MIDPYKPSNSAWDEGHMEWLMALLEPPEWHKRAKCRSMFPEGGDNIFFPQRGEVTRSNYPAKQICVTCPVKEECLEAGGTQQGIWGGLSQRQRKRLFRVPRTVSVDPTRASVTCGSEAGYKRHTRKGEKPCEACNDAHSRYRNPTGEPRKGRGGKLLAS